jgi:hypothetical protein
MLNLFQHPAKPRSAAARLLCERVSPRQTALGWMLKQVQNDDVAGGVILLLSCFAMRE